MSDGLGLTNGELEAIVGHKISPKLMFYLTVDATYFKASGRWYKSTEGTEEK